MFIFALIILCFPPIALFYSLYGLKKYQSQYWYFMMIFIITIFVMGYIYEPINSSDLTRYFAELKICQGMSLRSYFAWAGDGLFVKDIIFWIIGKSNAFNILTGLSLAIVYGIDGWILYQSAMVNDRRDLVLEILVFQLFLLPFISVINNVRNISCFALIICAVYRETVLKKKDWKTWCFYILPCFVHHTGFLLVILRILAGFSWGAIITSFFMLMIAPQIIVILYKRTEIITNILGTGIVRRFLDSAYSYLMDDGKSGWSLMVSRSISQQLNKKIMMGIAILSIGLLIWIMKEKICENYTYLVFNLLLCFITLTCNIFTIPAYWRFAAASTIASSYWYIILIKNINKASFIVKIMFFCLIVLGVSALIMQIWIGRNNIDIKIYILDFFLKNIYYTVFDILRHVWESI